MKVCRATNQDHADQTLTAMRLPWRGTPTAIRDARRVRKFLIQNLPALTLSALARLMKKDYAS